MCANGVTAGSRREGTPILAQQPPRRASGGRFGRVILLPRATGPGHVAVAVVVLFAPVDRNLPLRRRRHSPRRATLTHQRLEVRGIRHDPRKSTMEAWDAPGEPGDLSSLSAQTEWLNQQPRVWDCRIPEAEELDAAVQVSPSRARP